MMKETTREALMNAIDQGAVRFHHTSARSGYMSRKNPDGKVFEYKGRFGAGFVQVTPRFDSSRFVNYNYYLEVD